MSDKIVEINGKNYQLDEGDKYSGGPTYHEMELLPGSPHYGPYWNAVADAHVLCGKCRSDTFKVSSCNRNYETWAYCSCGNKLLLHSG